MGNSLGRALLLSAFLTPGCGDGPSEGTETSDGGSELECAPVGQQVACACPGGAPDGVQRCEVDGTLGECMGCPGTGDETAGDETTSATGDGDSSTSMGDGDGTTGDGDGTTGGDGTTSGDGDGTTGGDGDGTTGDGDGTTGCTDQLYAYYTACLGLADTTMSTNWYEACIEACPAMGCAGSECTRQCLNDRPLDPDVLACRATYPLCVYAVQPAAEVACHETCGERAEACYASATCTGTSIEAEGTFACLAALGGCGESCSDTETPLTTQEAFMDGDCGSYEALALTYCGQGGQPLTDCVAACPPTASCWEAQSCSDGCSATYYAVGSACEAKYPDCEPNPVTECQAACYAMSQSCIETTCDFTTCSATKSTCLAAC